MVVRKTSGFISLVVAVLVASLLIGVKCEFSFTSAPRCEWTVIPFLNPRAN
jgi:hypothetical protein